MHRIVTQILLVLILALIGCSAQQADVGDRLDELLGREPIANETEEDRWESAYEVSYALVAAINDRDYIAAFELLDILKEHPQRDQFWTRYIEAFIYCRLGRFDETLQILNELRPTSYNTGALELRGICYVSMNRLTEARRDFEDIDLTFPGGNSTALWNLWQISLSLGDFERAAEIERVLGERNTLDTRDMLATFDRAILNRDFVEAESAVERLPNLPTTIDDPFADFYDPTVLQARAQLEIARGEIDLGIEIMERIPGEIPGVTFTWPELPSLGLTIGRYDDAEFWAIKGILLSGGLEILEELEIDIPGSLDEYRSISRLLAHAETASLLASLGYVALNRGETDQALRFADKAIEMNPYETNAHLLMSSAHEIEGNFSEAADAAATGLLTAPYDMAVVVNYVRLAQRAPMALGPTDPDPGEVLTEILERSRDRYEIFPLDYMTQYNLAMTMHLAGEDGWEIYIGEALETWPFSINFQMEYIVSLALNGDLPGARVLYGNFDVPANLPWLVELYNRVIDTGSSDLLDFTSWLRSEWDPSGAYNPFLDAIAETALSETRP